MKKRSLSIVGIVGVPASYGGFETLVENLLQDMTKEVEVNVFCENEHYNDKLDTYKGASLSYLRFKANGVQSILYDFIALIKSMYKNDVILVLGVSAAFFFPIIRLFSNSKIISHIDGLEWKRDKWGYFEKKYLKISEYFAVKFSHIIISDNKAIQDYVLGNYKKQSELITYGADHVIKSEKGRFVDKYPFLNQPYFFSVCRIEPENNIQIQLEALAKSNVNIPYVVVGNWMASDYGKNLYKKFNDVRYIKLLNPIYEEVELNALRSNCFAYIHGHSAGGTNPSLVEAMYLGVPIISFDVNYNRETTSNQAIFFSNCEELKDIINNIESFNLSDVATKLNKLALDNYLWKKINNAYIKLILTV